MLLAEPPDVVSPAEKVPRRDSPVVSAMAFALAWPVIVTVSPAVVVIDMVPPVRADPASSTVIVAVAEVATRYMLAIEPELLKTKRFL